MIAKMDRASVARRISEGQFKKTLRVIEFKPAAGTCRDVTDEFPCYPVPEL
jgi:hypothetical protein